MSINIEQETNRISDIKKMLPNDDTIYNLAQLFKMFGDPTRAKILECLQIKDLSTNFTKIFHFFCLI